MRGTERIYKRTEMLIKILVAAHVSAPMPSDPCYLPLHVGKAGKEPIGYETDDTGDNISARNPSFCELTGIYWAWKNLNADYYGLTHYRRLFVRGFRFGAANRLRAALSSADYERLLQKADVILPTKRHYFVETTRSQYEHAHNPNDLAVLEQVVAEMHPEALEAFCHVMGQTSGHRFNMFVMSCEKFNDYCSFVFPILFEVEKRIDISNYDDYNRRVFGFLGERLMDVWIEARGVRYVEQSVAFIGEMDWPRKVYNFIMRKIRGGVKFTK